MAVRPSQLLPPPRPGARCRPCCRRPRRLSASSARSSEVRTNPAPPGVLQPAMRGRAFPRCRGHGASQEPHGLDRDLRAVDALLAPPHGSWFVEPHGVVAMRAGRRESYSPPGRQLRHSRGQGSVAGLRAFAGRPVDLVSVQHLGNRSSACCLSGPEASARVTAKPGGQDDASPAPDGSSSD